MSVTNSSAVGGEQHFAPATVLDAQHFFAIGVIAAALAPQVRRLDRRHLDCDMARAFLFLMHDIFDLAQHLEPKGSQE